MSAGYTNLRVVSYRDTIAELIDRANQTHTRATGVQVFSPGDGMAYEDSEGFINPISPALFDDARDQIAEASESLVATEAELEAAKLRIEETGTLLDSLDTQAQATAEEMKVISDSLDEDMKRLEETQSELDLLKPRLGDVETAISDSAENLSKALSDSASAAEKADDAKKAMDSLQAKLDAALKTKPGLIEDPSFETPEAWQPAYGSSVKADPRASSGGKVWYAPPASATGYSTAHAYPRSAPVKIVQGHVYRVTVRVMVESAPVDDVIRMVLRGGDPLTFKGVAGSVTLSSQELVVGQWALIQWDWEATLTEPLILGIQAGYHSVGKLIDDFQVVDITEQADLKLQVEDAKRTAVEAAANAQSAANKAGEAITASSGKATVTNKTTAPQGVGLAVGDIWFQWTSFPGGVVVGQWSWDGSKWVPVTLSHEVIDSLDMGKATVGQLDGGFIKAHSMESNRLTIGVGQNAIADPMFSSVDLTDRRVSEAVGKWTQNRAGALTFVESSGATSVSFRYSGFTSDRAFPTVAGQKWRIQIPVNPGGGQVRANVRWFNATGGSFYTSASSFVTGTEDTTISTIWEAPATAVGFTVDVYSPASTSSRTVRIYAGASVQSMTGTVHIEDGAITADKVNAREVAGAIGSFVNVKAENVEVTDTLAARVLSAATSQVATSFVTDRLVVGTGTDATVLEVLGAAVVNDLNLRGTLRGRDAILAGTLDVKQLNVTEDMAAQIVSAMTVNTKKLVVTEAAVMQHVTAIEGIITPLIEASEGRFNNLLADKASIDDISAGNITMTGHFRSGAIGKPGVIIPKNYTSQPGVEQLGIWLAPDGKAPSLGSELGMTAGIWLDTESNKSGSTNKSQLNIRGQNGRGAKIWGDLQIVPASNSRANIHSDTDIGLISTKGDLWGQGNALHYVARDGDVFFQSRGKGGMTFESMGSGDMGIGSAEKININAAQDLNLRGFRDVYLKAGDNIKLVRPDNTPYIRAWTGSGLRTVYIGESSGNIYTTTSTKRAKVDIETAKPDHTWLDMRTVTYRDRGAVELKERIDARRAAGDCAPLTAEESELLNLADQVIPGRIAEEGAEIDSPQVVYGSDGQAESWDYSRDAVMLTPHVREHRDKIADLEARIAELESALL